jgi:hypothetical protein
MNRATYGTNESPLGHGTRHYLSAAGNEISYNPQYGDLNVDISHKIVDFYIQDIKKKKIIGEQQGPTEKQLFDYMINSVFPEQLTLMLLEKSKDERFNLAIVVKNLPIPKKLENLFVSNLPEELREFYFNNPLTRLKK